MAHELAKVAVFMFIFSNVAAIYWNRKFIVGDSGKRYFPSTLECLYGLEIPSVIWNMPTCGELCLQKERMVLMDFNRSLGGKNWKKKWKIFMENKTSNNAFHCDWYGIMCDNATKHVLGIHLIENRVNGTLPVNLTNLRYLLAFRVSANPVQGQFDIIVVTMPRYLLCLDMTDTKITGSIPIVIANRLPFLSKLQLSGSKVRGVIPDSIGNLSHLTVLSLGQTRISGSVPQSISKLTHLWFLDFETLKLKGNLSFLYNLTKLRYIHLLSNQITGEIPEDIGERCPNLRELILSKNKISGQLPRSIGNLKYLQVMNVEKNNLSGLIPRELCRLHVRVLILSSNKFTGFETGSKHTFKSLEMFMASHLTAFNCSLHTLFSYIKGSRNTIMQIDISHSNVYGHLPGFVFSFLRLTSLKLASNNLTGIIPDPFYTMPYFTLLDLQDNDFSGPIPITFSRLLMLTELNVRGNKQLKGNVLPEFLHLDYNTEIKEQKSTACPMLRFDHNSGRIYVDPSYYNKTYCYCGEHFFGNGKCCIKCMPGGSCPGSKTKNLQSKEAKLRAFDDKEPEKAIMILKPGFFPCPNWSDVKSMHKCPSSGVYVKICVPEHNKCGCYVNTTERTVSRQKLTTLHRTQIICNKSCLCLLGHSGRFCSQCIEGYYKEGIHCNKCIVGPRRGAAFGILFAATIGSILIAATILCISTKRLKMSVFLAIVEVVALFCLVWKHLLPVVIPQIVIVIFILGFSSHLERCTALLKTAMFYLQVMDSLVSTTDIWPKSIHSMQVYISSSLNLSFSSLPCTLPHFFTLFVKSLMLFFLPFACIGLLWLVFFLSKLCTKRTNEKQLALNCKCRKYSLVIVDVAYFPIVRSCFLVIVGCRTIEGVSFMKSYPQIDCNSSEYSSLTAIAILELILYVIAIPFAIYLPLLLFYRNHLSDDSSTICNWLSPLITPYKPKYRTFIEVFMLLRRLIIAVLMTSFPPSSLLQALFITMLLLIAIIFETKVRPFKNPTEMRCGDERCKGGLGLENGMDIFMLSCVLLSFVCVGLSAGHGHLVPPALFVVLIATNGIFVFAFCCSILYRLLQGRSNTDYYVTLPERSESIPNINEDYHLRESSDP